MAIHSAARKLFATLGMLGITAGVLALFEGPHATRQAYAEYTHKNQICQKGLGRRCPQPDDPAYCPHPGAQGDYYCSSNPTSGLCGGSSPSKDCEGPFLPIFDPERPPPCGYKMECGFGSPMYDAQGDPLQCSQTYETCHEVDRPVDDPGLDP